MSSFRARITPCLGIAISAAFVLAGVREGPPGGARPSFVDRLLPCGPAALLEAVQATHPHEMGRMANIVGSDPTSRKPFCNLHELAQLARRCGIEPVGLHVAPGVLGTLPMPIVAHVEPGHFVALSGVDACNVALIEPDGSTRRVSRSLFDRQFTGHVLCLRRPT